MSRPASSQSRVASPPPALADASDYTLSPSYMRLALSPSGLPTASLPSPLLRPTSRGSSGAGGLPLEAALLPLSRPRTRSGKRTAGESERAWLSGLRDSRPEAEVLLLTAPSELLAASSDACARPGTSPGAAGGVGARWRRSAVKRGRSGALAAPIISRAVRSDVLRRHRKRRRRRADGELPFMAAQEAALEHLLRHYPDIGGSGRRRASMEQLLRRRAREWQRYRVEMESRPPVPLLSTREAASQLEAWLALSVQAVQDEQDGDGDGDGDDAAAAPPRAQAAQLLALYSVAFHQLLQLVGDSCAELGQLLGEVWQGCFAVLRTVVDGVVAAAAAAGAAEQRGRSTSRSRSRSRSRSPSPHSPSAALAAAVRNSSGSVSKSDGDASSSQRRRQRRRQRRERRRSSTRSRMSSSLLLPPSTAAAPVAYTSDGGDSARSSRRSSRASVRSVASSSKSNSILLADMATVGSHSYEVAMSTMRDVASGRRMSRRLSGGTVVAASMKPAGRAAAAGTVAASAAAAPAVHDVSTSTAGSSSSPPAAAAGDTLSPPLSRFIELLEADLKKERRDSDARLLSIAEEAMRRAQRRHVGCQVTRVVAQKHSSSQTDLVMVGELEEQPLPAGGIDPASSFGSAIPRHWLPSRLEKWPKSRVLQTVTLLLDCAAARQAEQLWRRGNGMLPPLALCAQEAALHWTGSHADATALLYHLLCNAHGFLTKTASQRLTATEQRLLQLFARMCGGMGALAEDVCLTEQESSYVLLLRTMALNGGSASARTVSHLLPMSAVRPLLVALHRSGGSGSSGGSSAKEEEEQTAAAIDAWIDGVVEQLAEVAVRDPGARSAVRSAGTAATALVIDVVQLLTTAVGAARAASLPLLRSALEEMSERQAPSLDSLRAVLRALGEPASGAAALLRRWEACGRVARSRPVQLLRASWYGHVAWRAIGRVLQPSRPVESFAEAAVPIKLPAAVVSVLERFDWDGRRDALTRTAVRLLWVHAEPVLSAHSRVARVTPAVGKEVASLDELARRTLRQIRKDDEPAESALAMWRHVLALWRVQRSRLSDGVKHSIAEIAFVAMAEKFGLKM